jgi:peptidoglycan/xylan/chitin deacetylase (PgdA/CDA1 family)
MISVCLRFDDPSPSSDHALEKGIIEILLRHGACASFAVIPFRATGRDGELRKWTSDKASHLVDAADNGIIEIAQHGTTHVSTSETESGIPSEFYGMPFTRQFSRIQDGLAELQRVFGNRIGGFVPPWNTYDINTTKAAEEAGLDYLSPSLDIFKYGKLPIIPKTCNLLGARSAIEEAIRYDSLNPSVIVVLHPYQFEEFHQIPDPDERPPFTSLGKFNELVNWIQSREKVKIKTLTSLSKCTTSQNPMWRFEDTAWFKHLPYRIKKHFPVKLLLQGNKLSALRAVMRGID